MTRRGLLAGLGAMLAAPAIIRTPGLLMPVRPALLVAGVDIERDVLADAQLVALDRMVEFAMRRRIQPVQTPDGPMYLAYVGKVA